MTATTKYPATPYCGYCYLDSARRAATAQADPRVRDIILRTARARYDSGGPPGYTTAAHALHSRRRTPWPSERAAAA